MDWIQQALYPANENVGPWLLFQFVNLYTVGRTPWTGDQPVARSLPAHTGQHKHKINAHRHPCLKWDSNPRSQCLSGRRQVHGLGRPAIVIGTSLFCVRKLSDSWIQIENSLSLKTDDIRNCQIRVWWVRAALLFLRNWVQTENAGTWNPRKPVVG
jgi:hypothetical protein